MTKKRTRKQTYADIADVIKNMKEGKPVKRHGTADGSISTSPITPVPDLLESVVLRDCLLWLRCHGILCNRNNVGAGTMGASGYYSYGIKNAGDIVGLTKKGIHFEIEAKRGKGGRLSLGQQKRMRDVRNNNGIYLVVHGINELEYYDITYGYFTDRR